MTEEELYQKAKKKVKQKKDFYIHFGIYCVCILMCYMINNVLTYTFFQWWILAALGWGMGIVGNFISVFGLPWQYSGEDWEEKEIEKEMRMLERRQGFTREPDDDITIPDDELELRDFKKLRREWDDQDLV